ncbi:hypothetical protein ACIBCM_20440 [Streptomyces sp. NPDC051018]|uniref:hypothetical protein n=1 Tax=Streptomyces sp. NPDC051018 TaxID=3365639 RepID=UPI00378ADF66
MPDMSASANLAISHAATLAKELDENKVTPGVLGFLIFAVMAVGVWFLMKSMNRHMGRIDFDETAVPDARAPKPSSSSTSASASDSGTA